MKKILPQLLISSSLWLISTNAIRGQIVPDNTISTSVNQTDNVFEIKGGTQVGRNLFHSFQQFSVPTGSEAFFNNPKTINNIISRVTGGSISNIDGLIRANGNANLFLINPAGIIFGSNATLNIGGSFLSSSADSLVFPEGKFSATDIHNAPLLTISMPIGLNFGSNPGKIINRSQSSLNGAVNGLVLFAENPNFQDFAVGLQVFPGKTIALIGGVVNFENGNLSAPGGNIELGSVSGNSFVSINKMNSGFTLGYEKVNNFQDIMFSKSIIDTTNFSNLVNRSGTINLQGKKITITDASAIFAINFGNLTGGEIKILSSESINILRDDANIFTLASVNKGNGAAGNIKIETKNLSIVNGSFIASFPSATASSGEIKIKVSDLIKVIGVEIDKKGFSGISIQSLPNFTGGDGKTLTIETEKLIVKDGAQIGSIALDMTRGADVNIKASIIEVEGNREVLDVLSDGTLASVLIGSAILTQAEVNSISDSGNLIIETDRLTIQNGGFVSTSVKGFGQGGDLTINASSSIFLNGTSPTASLFRGSSGLFTLADINSIGNGGNLNISTPQLIVENGAKVSSETFGKGNAGNITLNTNRLIVRNGGQVSAGSLIAEEIGDNIRGAGGNLTINASESVEIIGTGKIGNTSVNSSLFTKAEGTGDAANLTISTPNLTVAEAGNINASATGTGEAGSLIIKAKTITLDNASLTAETRTGDKGNINLNNVDTLLLRNNSQITTDALQEATGGDITIISDLITALDNSDITANAVEGRGGDIQITTQGLFRDSDSEITASSQLGIDGTIIFNTPDVDPASGLVKLPSVPIDAEAILARDLCKVEDEKIAQGSSFFITGRGGLTPTSEEPLDDLDRVVGWSNRDDLKVNKNGVAEVSQGLPSDTVETSNLVIEEAQGWITNSDGKILLTANAPKIMPQNLEIVHPDCQTRSQAKITTK